MTTGQQDLCVRMHESGMRLDAFVAAHVRQTTRSQAALWIRRGDVQVEGRIRKAGYKVKPGEKIHVRIPPPLPTGIVAESIPLQILFEDSALIVLNKPAGVVVHPSAGHPSGTLVNALLHHCEDLAGIGGEQRPGIVHRLDKDTSGVLLVAKNDAAHQALSRQFKERTVLKKYMALVAGEVVPERGVIDRPLARHSSERKRMAVAAYGGREAITLWLVRERFAAATLLEVELKTGRTHQIRVHCLSMGHPIVGDPVYGRRRTATHARGREQAAAVLLQARRQMLHAAQIRFAHPLNGAPMSFEAPLPVDFASLLQALREFR